MNNKNILRSLLACVISFVLANTANAAVAVAFSESAKPGSNWAVVANEAHKEVAGQKAIEQCAKKSGRSDCKVILASDKTGYGALYATCVTDRECFVSAITGFVDRNAAHDAVLADCKQYYGVASCTPWGDWQDSGGSQSVADNAGKPGPRVQASADAQQPAAASGPKSNGTQAAAQSTTESVRENQQACDKGFATGCSNLGGFYETGNGVRQDHQRAIQLFEKACGGSSATGCLLLGTFYKSGNGVTQDDQKAIQFFEKACGLGGLGEAEGCLALAIYYEHGDGIRQDQQKAVQFYEKACGLGDAMSCAQLVHIYADGNGVRQDQQRAVQFIKKACSLDAKYCSK